MSEPTAPKPGIPLTVIATGEGEVTLEDPDGIAFTVPQHWVDHDVERDFNLDHTAISGAPQGELERIWHKATAEGYEEQGHDGSDVESNLDQWNAGTWNPLKKNEIYDLIAKYPQHQQDPQSGGFVPASPEGRFAGGPAKFPTIPEGGGVTPQSSLLRMYQEGQKKARGFTPLSAEEAGKNKSGWGNADQTWDRRTNSWKKGSSR
jgi:hypothetical protein